MNQINPINKSTVLSQKFMFLSSSSFRIAVIIGHHISIILEVFRHPKKLNNAYTRIEILFKNLKLFQLKQTENKRKH